MSLQDQIQGRTADTAIFSGCSNGNKQRGALTLFEGASTLFQRPLRERIASTTTGVFRQRGALNPEISSTRHRLRDRSMDRNKEADLSLP